MNGNINNSNDLVTDIIRTISMSFNMVDMSEQNKKIRLYRAGRFTGVDKFQPEWTEADRIRHIDNHGRWLAMADPMFAKDGTPYCPHCGRDLDIYPKDTDAGIFNEFWDCPGDCGFSHRID